MNIIMKKTGDETIIMNEKYKNTCIYGQHRVGIYHRHIIIDIHLMYVKTYSMLDEWCNYS